MAKHYDRNTKQFDDLITYVYSPAHIQNPRKLKRLLNMYGWLINNFVIKRRKILPSIYLLTTSS